LICVLQPNFTVTLGMAPFCTSVHVVGQRMIFVGLAASS
jgi:hypothetical protein